MTSSDNLAKNLDKLSVNEFKMIKAEHSRLTYNIKKMREIRGYDQQYMANQLGIKQNTYSRIETGETKLTEERLEKIAQILGTSIEAIKGFNETMVFNIQHQEGHSGNISIYNAADEILKAFESHTKPFKEKIKQLEDEIKFLRKLVNDKK